MSRILVLDDLTLQIRRSERRRTLGITVDRDGTVQVAAPPHAPDKVLRSFVESKREWIYTKLEAKDDFNTHRPPPKGYVTGEEFWYLGRIHRLELVDAVHSAKPLRLRSGRFLLFASETDEGRDHFVSWYREHLRPLVTSLSRSLAARIGAAPEGVFIQDLGHRWGSCGRRGRLNYHWRTAMLPHDAIEYVVAHEVAHLVDDTHGERFWQRVERLLPDYRERRSWLAREGAKFDL